MLQLNMVLYNSFYSNRRPLVDNRVLLLKWDNNIKISGNSDKKFTYKRLKFLRLKKKIENWRRIKREIGLTLLNLKLKVIIVLSDHFGLCSSSPPSWYWIDIIITFIKINKNLKWDFKLNVFITFLQFYNFGFQSSRLIPLPYDFVGFGWICGVMIFTSLPTKTLYQV